MDITEIENVLITQIEENKTPSVQYVLFNKDTVIHRFYYGSTDIKNQIKADENTTYKAFSVTKTFTALAILQLAEKGKLNIDHSVKQYLTDIPYSADITIRQLLAHSAGVPNPIPLRWIHLISEHQTFERNDFFRPILTKNNKTKTKPNEKYAYSNLGYILLGQVIENVSGFKYEEFIALGRKWAYLQENNMLPYEPELKAFYFNQSTSKIFQEFQKESVVSG